MADRNALIKQIGEISFMLDDLRLYLDNHPAETNALGMYAEYSARRKQLLKEYATQFDPLTCDCIPDTNGGNLDHWSWPDGPVPWDTEANVFADNLCKCHNTVLGTNSHPAGCECQATQKGGN